jgi:hypothetical protein
MSPKIVLAAILTVLCIILSGIGENIFVAYTQCICYVYIVYLCVSRYYEED